MDLPKQPLDLPLFNILGRQRDRDKAIADCNWCIYLEFKIQNAIMPSLESEHAAQVQWLVQFTKFKDFMKRK